MLAGTEEPNLFLRKENESGEYNEDWDDNDLITAYDKAVSAVKRQITRKIQKELGLKDEDIQEFLSDAGSSSSKSKENEKGDRKKSRQRKWKIGSSCRAVYSEDGEEYEAVIVKIIDKDCCVVRYVGYENEEEVKLKDLTPSLGKNVVQIQIEEANKEVEEVIRKFQKESGLKDEDIQEILSAAGFSSSNSKENGKGDRKKSRQRKLQGVVDDDEEEEEHHDEVPKEQVRQGFVTDKNHSPIEGNGRMREPMMKRLPMSFPFPPPPPVLPAMMPKDLIGKQNDINSMLMSWYMCGYYTGLYERGQQLENN